jgi:hypothetical protein
MSDDTLTAPVDQAPADTPAPAALSAQDRQALVADLVTALAAAGAPTAAVLSPGPAAAATSPSSPAPADAVPTPVDASAAVSKYKPGSLAIYQHDHFGKTTYQVMLVIGVYSVPDAAGALQERLRMLPIGSATAYSDLPSDQVTSAAAFDWEAAA